MVHSLGQVRQVGNLRSLFSGVTLEGWLWGKIMIYRSHCCVFCLFSLFPTYFQTALRLSIKSKDLMHQTLLRTQLCFKSSLELLNPIIRKLDEDNAHLQITDQLIRTFWGHKNIPCRDEFWDSGLLRIFETTFYISNII